MHKQTREQGPLRKIATLWILVGLSYSALTRWGQFWTCAALQFQEPGKVKEKSKVLMESGHLQD